MMLWLDDLREPPEGWKWTKTYRHARMILSQVPVDIASLDHDLGIIPHPKDDDMRVYPASQEVAPTGYDLLLWMVEESVWPTESLAVHSANNVGVRNMCGVIERYGPYEYRDFIKYAGTEYDAIRYSKTEG